MTMGDKRTEVKLKELENDVKHSGIWAFVVCYVVTIICLTIAYYK